MLVWRMVGTSLAMFLRLSACMVRGFHFKGWPAMTFDPQSTRALRLQLLILAAQKRQRPILRRVLE